MLNDLVTGIGPVVQDAIAKRYPERAWPRDQIAGELALSWLRFHPQALKELDLGLTYGSSAHDAEKLAELSVLWEHGVDAILSELEMAIPHELQGEQRAKAWRHQPSSRIQDKKDRDDSLALDALSRAAALYLRAKWADSPSLECWLARQMIYAETFALSREVGVPLPTFSGRFWWEFVISTVKWLVGVFVALSIGQEHGAGIGLLTYVAWICMVHFLGRDRAKIKLEMLAVVLQMQAAYRVSLRNTTYPLEVERHLALAEDKGAVWPEGLRPLLHKATTRSPLSWAIHY